MTPVGLRLFQSRFMRFALVGGAGFVVNEAVLVACLEAVHLNKYQAWLPAFLVSVTFTWWGNRTLTFREFAAKRGLALEWASFVAANSMGAVANAGMYYALVRFAPPPLGNPLVALAAGTLTGLAFNFAASKRFVFRDRSS